MCQFFSLISDGKGKVYYFKNKKRKLFLKEKMKQSSPDSHTSIADYYGFKGTKEDVMNKFEYNPLTKEFTVDQINAKTDDSEEVRKICERLDFKKIIPELIIHPIIHPFNDIRTNKATKADITLLKKWNSVVNSVGYSVRDSVRNSVVNNSVRDSVRNSVVNNSVGYSVENSVIYSVESSVVNNSVGYSVGNSVMYSARNSMWAYISSFFNLSKWKYCDKIKYKKGTNPFQSCIDLWNKGLVPSYDGKHWRLHGAGGKILWEGKIK